MSKRLLGRASVRLAAILFLAATPLLLAVAPPVAPEVAAQLAVFGKKAPAGLKDLLVIQKTVKNVLKTAVPATVGLRVGASAGSGVIVSEDGYILTAGHVSGKPGEVCDVVLSTGKIVKGKTLGQNTGIDSGMIKITTKGKYPFVPMGKSSTLKTGQWTVAVGHPRGYYPGRAPVVRVGRIIFTNDNVIRTDNALVGGDSGGPLFDMHGNVIGIHSRINLAMEMNFHVPMDTYHKTWDRLAKGDSWGSGMFGFSFPPARPRAKAVMGVSFNLRSDDLKITDVDEALPAYKAGIQVGDVITAIDGTKMAKRDDLMTYMSKKKPGDTVSVTVDREGKSQTFKVKLVERPAD